MNSPFVLVIFGATGDLARNKLLPALFSLYKNKQLGEKCYIVGFARREFSDTDYALLCKESIEVSEGEEVLWQEFAKNIYYQQGIFNEIIGYESLIQKLNTFDTEIGACITRLFYLATPPDNYETILYFLSSTKLSEGCGQGSSKWTRIAIEKPFGKDLETAKTLDKKLSEIFEERQIFRVDHYLGKETVQNMIAFRFANGIFEPIWNNMYIDHVQITWGEKQGVGERGAFFDGVGLLRDVAQNHLMQLIATVAMEQPKSFSREDIRNARFDAIEAIRCINAQDVSQCVVRGQYNGYKNEKNVSPDSVTETFLALKLFVDTPRLRGVPFYVRAGKKMPKDLVEISLVFKQTCHILFKEYGCPEEGNILTIRIQPDEGIRMRVIAKKPSFAKALDGKPNNKLSLGTVDMKFTYKEEFGGRVADAYERLLLDILNGDQMLFNRSDELESSWDFITQILTGWKNGAADLKTYDPQTWGPKDVVHLIEKDGRKWIEG